MKTCKISVYTISRQINEIIEFLHKSEIMEPAQRGADGTERAIRNIDDAVKRADRALAALDRYKPCKDGIFKKRKRAAKSDYSMDKKQTAAAVSAVSEILKLCREIEKNNDELGKINLRLGQLGEWKGLNVSEFVQKTEHTQTLCGSCRSISAEDFEKRTEEIGVHLYCRVIKSTKREMLIWCIFLKKDEVRVRELLKDLEFSPPSFSLNGHTPQEEMLILKNTKKELEKKNEKLAEKIRTAAKGRRIIELYYDRLLLKRERYEALSEAENTEKTFVLTGYVPEKYAERLIGTIERKFCAAAEIEEPDEGELLPVAFENNALVSPVEEITASYSMPSESDIDPNPVMSVFYYWFFGMMFSDAGYGILMMLVCGILGFSHILEKDRRKMLKMFFWCGVSTTLWGLAYGSFFGDLIGTVSKTFGSGKTEFLPVLIDPVNQALELLIISVAFGMVHILTALVLKFIKLWKSGDRQGAVFDVGLWIGVLAGLSIFAVGAGFNNALIKNIGLGASVIGATGLVLTGGRDKKSPIAKFFSGVLSLYDITGFVGDILSYSRLMALGLATGVIASVVNVLGSLGGNSPVGVIMFVIISIFGHSLNFAINMLGAYVHTNRLQYVEFYQKFYEGGGKRFRPMKLDTKYFDFSDN